jgi:hypothetical protein
MVPGAIQKIFASGANLPANSPVRQDKQQQVHLFWRSLTLEKSVKPKIGKCNAALSISNVGQHAHLYSSESPMANKNLQTLAVNVANIQGVVMTGPECGSKQAAGMFPTHLLSLLWHPLPGLYLPRPEELPDAEFAEDNSAMAPPAIGRAGRSASSPGVSRSTQRLARTASRTVLSKRSSSRRPDRCLKANQRRGLAYLTTNTVRG